MFAVEVLQFSLPFFKIKHHFRKTRKTQISFLHVSAISAPYASLYQHYEIEILLLVKQCKYSHVSIILVRYLIILLIDWLVVAKRTAHNPLACYQPPPQARQRLTHLAWNPHTQTRLGQSHCHTPPVNEMRLSIRHAKVASCRDTQQRFPTEHARHHAAWFARL